MAAPDDQREQLIRRAVNAFNSSDIDALIAAFDPAARIYGHPELAERDVYEGPDGIRAWIAEARARWTSLRFHYRDMETVGRHALAAIDLVGVNEPSGGGAWRLHVAFVFAGETIVEAHALPDRDVARARLPGA